MFPVGDQTCRRWRWITAFFVYSFNWQFADAAVIRWDAPEPADSPNSSVVIRAQSAQDPTPSTASTFSQMNQITIIALVIGGIFLLGFGLVIWVILRGNRKALERRTGIILESSAPEFRKDAPPALAVKTAPLADNNESGINRSSWASYVVSIPGAQDYGLSPSNTISTRQLYISNQARRAREKAVELERSSTGRHSLESSSSRQDSIRSPSSWTGSEETAAVSPRNVVPRKSASPVPF
ncbi:hypothetical protein C8R46DRAFT_1113912 [Mycena filopes]|nr:hypothetical protein C8R46DRAFT_1113912 [Mycena filopes]